MARSEGLYERFASSVAPSIYGNIGELFPTIGGILRLMGLGGRYQKGGDVFAHGREQEDPSRQHEITRRRECATAR